MSFKAVNFNIEIKASDATLVLAKEFEQILNFHATQGWEFVRTEQVRTTVRPNQGCFGLGATPGFIVNRPIILFQKGQTSYTIQTENKTKNETPVNYSFLDDITTQELADAGSIIEQTATKEAAITSVITSLSDVQSTDVSEQYLYTNEQNIALKKLTILHEDGILTDAEFEEQKIIILKNQ